MQRPRYDRGMRLHLAWVIGLLACGNVKNAPGTSQDAALPDGPAACTVHDTVDSCGAACTRCPAADDRQTPTCNGTACGVACLGGAPRCSDNSCSQLAWTFDANRIDGIAPRMPSGLVLAVRNHAGNLALAMDVTFGASLGEVSFRVPVCVSGNLQLQTRTLSATVFFEGGTDTGNQYYVQSSVPAPMAGAYLTTTAVPSGSYVNYTAPISMSQFANTATDVVFQAGTLGAPFTGTIWFDDIKIQ